MLFDEAATSTARNAAHGKREPSANSPARATGVLRCAHTLEFVASLEILQAEFRGTVPEKYADMRRGRTFNPREGALMVIDSIGTFYYRDKMTEAMAGEGTSLQKHALRCVAKLVAEKYVLLLAAKPVLFNAREGQPEGEHREYMPPVWQKVVTFRVDVVLKDPLTEEDIGDRNDPMARGRCFDIYISKGLPGSY